MAKQFFDVKCRDCGEITEKFDHLVGFDVLLECDACGGDALRIVSYPNVMGKEAYRDGYQRTGWGDLKKAAKLDAEAMNVPEAKRAEYKKEAAKHRESAKRALERKGGE